MNPSPTRAVFLDRDGVINHKASEGDYIRTWGEVQFIPGAVEAVASLNRAGYKVFVVTNQRGIATHRVRLEDLLEIHLHIQKKFALAGALISQIYYCPHDLAQRCSCRKPQPGMLRLAAREHHLDLATCWMVGDSLSDVKAGENAGCQSVLLTSHLAGMLPNSDATLVAESLQSAVPLILNLGEPSTRFVRTQPFELSRSCLREDS
jgi:D-glycero-D-manno-heptose 1,7-bisphosphate phosphatase